MVSGLVATSMTVNWAAREDTSENYLGGLNWGKQVFNYHPVLMVAGFMFLSVSAMLSYRVINLPKNQQKALHALMHAGAIVCILTALAAVVTSHNYTDHNTSGTYSANLYSNHSFMGMAAIVLFLSQYILAFLIFGLKLSPSSAKWFKPNHIFIGVFTLFAAVFAVESGLTELTTKLSCSYDVTSADWNPANNYHKLTNGCQLANGIGIMVFITALFAAYALIGPNAAANAASASSSSRQPSGAGAGASGEPQSAEETQNALFEKLNA
jgi:hypothetical protein